MCAFLPILYVHALYVIMGVPSRHENVSRTLSCMVHPVTELWHRSPSRSITEPHKHRGANHGASWSKAHRRQSWTITTLNDVGLHQAVSHHCQGEVGCQTTTPQRSASQRITAHIRESHRITAITKHHGHLGVHHASLRGANHACSQHR